MIDAYTSIELGSNSIKIVVTEKINNKFHVLASICEPSLGIKKGQIEDSKTAVICVKRALKKANEMLGFKITKVIVSVPMTNCNMDIVVGSVDTINSDEITGEDITNVIKDAILGHIPVEEELVTAIPISFKLDNGEDISNPKGLSGNILETKLVISTLDKLKIYKILEVLKLSGVEAIDVAFKANGDYFAIKNAEYDKQVGAIINIGEDSTSVSVFNKGIMIKNAIVPIGSKNVDNDISYIFKCDNIKSRQIKETFSIAMARYADGNDYCEIETKTGEKKELSQVDVSKVVEARLREIIKLSNNELKNLTKRQIRYIIITGGISELAGFGYLVDNAFGRIGKVCNITTMGIRHNKYSSCYGLCKYFSDKIMLRDKNVKMITDSDMGSLITVRDNIKSGENIISKVFGTFR